jgi:hypothetical protein
LVLVEGHMRAALWFAAHWRAPSNGLTHPLPELFPALGTENAPQIGMLQSQQQPCLYRQAVQCHDAFTQIISLPQRGQELSSVVVGPARSPGLQAVDVGRASAMT